MISFVDFHYFSCFHTRKEDLKVILIFLRRRTLKQFFIFILISFFVLSACNVDEILNDVENSNITAKSKRNEVVSAAKTDFASDAQLSAIYGLNVSTKGEIDLSKPTDNAFVYVVQSDIKQSNEFYVPVFGAGPVKSPINFILFVADYFIM